jgi:DNA-binding GntR family transcriptional regulator
MAIVVRTLSEQVFEIVREQIVTGKLVGNTPIRQDALATELGVSKIPLREALARLEQEGLLTSHANRGYSVQPMSAVEADDIFALRLSIEPNAAAYASTVATASDHEIAKAAFEELDSAAGERLAEVAIANRVFHTALVRPGRRLLTTQTVERLAILAERYGAGRGPTDDAAGQPHPIDIARPAWSVRVRFRLNSTLLGVRTCLDRGNRSERLRSFNSIVWPRLLAGRI